MEIIRMIIQAIALIAVARVLASRFYDLLAADTFGYGEDIRKKSSRVLEHTVRELQHASEFPRPAYERSVPETGTVAFSAYHGSGANIRTFVFDESGYFICDGDNKEIRRTVPNGFIEAIRWKRFFREYLKTV